MSVLVSMMYKVNKKLANLQTMPQVSMSVYDVQSQQKAGQPSNNATSLHVYEYDVMMAHSLQTRIVEKVDGQFLHVLRRL